MADEQALAVYSAHFEKTSVVAASCADYRAAAMVDAAEEEADKVEGRKIGVPTLVLFSKAYLGARYDVEGVWREWVEEGKLVARGLEGVGHFLFEEDPELAYGIVRGWVEDVLAAVV